MKNIYFLLIVFVFSGKSIAQSFSEFDLKSLISSEAKSNQNLLDYNINPNTLNYDLRYQRLDLKINPTEVYLSGTVISHFIPNQNMNEIYFDFTDKLNVSEVKYHSQNLTFSQLPSKEIKINFLGSLQTGVLDSLSIKFSGVPETTEKGLYFNSVAGKPIAYTLTEPYGAREWFPTKQSLNDKIEKVDLLITTPKEFDVAANGKLISVTNLPGDWHQTFWQTNYPIASYLVAIGVADYAKHYDVISNPPFPFVNYIYPINNGGSTLENVEWTKQIMPIYEQLFGSYPYRDEKYGHMDCTAYGGAMEHATMSTMGYWGKDGIAHELAHQWFGDKITCGAWNDIWLNEGFATFGTHIAYEKLLVDHSGFLDFLKNQLASATYYAQGSVYVPDADLGNVTRVFDGRLTYAKGGYILRMLKWILGEGVFYAALKDYTSRPNLEYSYAKTPDFKTSLEQSTGKDFTSFFNNWIYGEGYPSYQISWNQTGSKFYLKALQTQSSSTVNFFALPLPIRIKGINGEEKLLKLENYTNGQVFQDDLNFQISSVEFNYEYQIIEKNSQLTYDASLTVSENTKESLKIYPNPVQNELHILGLTKNSNYIIYTASGDIISKGSLCKNDAIDVKLLGNGLYFVVIDNTKLKFIKK